MAHRPELLQAWAHLKDAFVGPSATLSAQLKEEVRRTLAQRTGCQFCASLGQPAKTHTAQPRRSSGRSAASIGKIVSVSRSRQRSPLDRPVSGRVVS